MAGYRTSTSVTSGSTAVASFTITVPAGVVPTDAVFVLACSATTSGTAHTGSGGLAAVGMTGGLLGTSGRATLLKGTGFTAGDVITITCPASALAGALLVAYDSTTQVVDVTGAVSATGTTATIVAPSLNTAQANEVVVNFAVGLGSAARTVTGIAPGTSRATSAAGGNTRFFAFGVSDQTITSAGASGTVTTTTSGTLLGSAAVQLALKAAAVGNTVRKANVAGVATTATRRVNVAGTATAANRRVNVGGVAT